MVRYRKALVEDIPLIKCFVDFWLSGRGKALKIPNASNDYFITANQHKCKIKYGTVYLAFEDCSLVGWAAKGKNDTLFYLLVAGNRRGQGIGRDLLKLLDPEFVRSKSDQSTGDPLGFYLKMNFEILSPNQGRKRNIDILKKKR